MATSIPSNATPTMLEWARKTAGFSVEDVAKAEKLPAEDISAWESDDGTPSLAKLRRLSKRYKRPLMVFYLPEPPRDFSVVKDFRLLPAGVSREFSPDLCFAIRDVVERQAWASQQLEESESAKATIVGTATLASDVGQLANDLRQRLQVTVEMQAECQTWRDAFRLWRSGCERLGVFVFQVPKVPVVEMRGFALPDSYAPAVAINSKDAVAAKTFTLIHELVHLCLGESAITGAGEFDFSPDPDYEIERFCNRVAAETLVPESDVVPRIPADWRSRDDEIIENLARRYRVSRAVIVLRMVEAGLSDTKYLVEKLPSLTSPPPKKGDPPKVPQYRLAISKVGEPFARLALSAYYAGEIHGGALSSLVGLKLRHLSALESHLYPGWDHSDPTPVLP